MKKFIYLFILIFLVFGCSSSVNNDELDQLQKQIDEHQKEIDSKQQSDSETVQEDTETSDYINIIKNVNPEFVNKQLFDFHLSETSPCNSAGDFNITQSESVLFLDLEGNLRDNVPDLGALEQN